MCQATDDVASSARLEVRVCSPVEEARDDELPTLEGGASAPERRVPPALDPRTWFLAVDHPGAKMRSMEANEKRRGRAIWIVAGVAFVAVIVSWFFSSSVVEALYDQMPERGQFGDQFGAINALFSGLAFAGVIVAILLQGEELKLQRQELADTRAELKRQADAAERQETALVNQRRAMLLSAAISGAAGLAEASRTGVQTTIDRNAVEQLKNVLNQVLEELDLTHVDLPELPRGGDVR